MLKQNEMQQESVQKLSIWRISNHIEMLQKLIPIFGYILLKIV